MNPCQDMNYLNNQKNCIDKRFFLHIFTIDVHKIKLMNAQLKQLKMQNSTTMTILNQNNMKQSSIEYLVKELENLTQIEFDGIGKPIIEHAELLHKLEIQSAFLKNDNSVSIDYALERFEKYYKETFKNK